MLWVLTLVVEFLVVPADVVEFRVAEPVVAVLLADVVALRPPELLTPEVLADVEEDALFDP